MKKSIFIIIILLNSPKFTRTFKVPFIFEIVQDMRFVVYDTNDFNVPPEKIKLRTDNIIGYLEISLQEIHKKQQSHPLTNRSNSAINWGNITIKSEEVSHKTDIITLKLGCRDFPTGNIFLMINRKGENKSLTACYRSEVQNNFNGDFYFNDITLSSQKLCNGDFYRPLVFETYQWGKNGDHILIASCEGSVNTLRRKNKIPLRFNNIVVGELTVVCNIIKQPTFLSYIRSGCELNFMVGIDFTGSNGDPCDDDSLHYISDHGDNQYETALKTVGNVLEHYDTDKMFPSYGFGCAYRGEVNHCLPLNEDEYNPEVHGVQGIITAYHNIIKKISFAGPTLFSVILDKAIDVARSYEETPGEKYLILLIITDGVIDDMEETIDLLVQISFFI